MPDVAPADCTILGMPLLVDDDDQITAIQPVSGFVAIKGLDSDGHVVYCTAATDGVTSVECLGLAEYAALKLRTGMAARMEGGEQP